MHGLRLAVAWAFMMISEQGSSQGYAEKRITDLMPKFRSRSFQSSRFQSSSCPRLLGHPGLFPRVLASKLILHPHNAVGCCHRAWTGAVCRKRSRSGARSRSTALSTKRSVVQRDFCASGWHGRMSDGTLPAQPAFVFERQWFAA